MDTSPNNTASEKRLFKWQRMLLPWMIALPTALILIFVYLATDQLKVFNSSIHLHQVSELDKVFVDPQTSKLIIPEGVDKAQYVKLYTLAKMDEQLINKRYNQGSVLLQSRIYTKYLGFFTGMIMCIVGAIFIISKLKEDQTQLDASNETLKVSLLSSSPGIIFGVLGTILMSITILNHNDIDIRDTATFLLPNAVETVTTSPATTPPDSTDAMMRSSFPPK